MSTPVHAEIDSRKTTRVLVNALSLTHGGGRSYILNVLRELSGDQRGCDVTFLVAEGQLTDDECAGIRVRFVRLPPKPAALRLLLRVLFEQIVVPILAMRYDVLFCVADMTPALAGTPTVVILRNLNIYDHRFYDDLRLRTLNLLTRVGLRRVSKVLFPTRAAADLIRRSVAIPESRVVVNPYGIAQESFDTTAGPIDTERPFLFTPAAIERHKNLGVAIQSLQHVRSSNLELWLVGPDQGDPGYLEELRRLAATEGVEDRVRFVGPVPYSEIQRYYLGATALLFPSEIETYGHPIVEAMLAGTPIIASDIPAFRELAGQAGRYFPTRDPRALAAVIEELLSDAPGAEDRRAIGHRRAAELNWARHVDTLCETLRDSAGSNGD
ncbi:MAG: glycosyltransferase family 1 protein [Myxococcota bacterium]